MGDVRTIRRVAAVQRARELRRRVVEADGGQHADNVAYDRRRTAYLARSGLRVLRFWNTDILTNRDGVCLAILEACGGEREGYGGEG